ncbi:hypothetical protein [Sandaracinobacteroides saxicola]|uniref:Uncharacterized protein n=1 Tax=Sandaracinobacteroides saxicola TaxID=2759707 RepID=A0A7G5IK01_9SPHN|nr:hypothetical protein [Sandaracinobacteroides saxicola]QMW23693.1 hypothetical protein H3309_04170 [Sandaracinobacteroides saxicola]
MSDYHAQRPVTVQSDRRREAGERIEALVAIAQANDCRRHGDVSRQQRCLYDNAFVELRSLVAPICRAAIRRARLLDHADDAQQAADLALMAAIERYVPGNSAFTTFLHYQLLDQLKRIVRTYYGTVKEDGVEQRVAPVALPVLNAGETEEQQAESVDDDALLRMEHHVGAMLSRKALSSLLTLFEMRTVDVLSRAAAEPALDPHRVAQAMRRTFELLEVEECDADTAVQVLGINRERAREIATCVRQQLAQIATVRLSEARMAARAGAPVASLTNLPPISRPQQRNLQRLARLLIPSAPLSLAA